MMAKTHMLIGISYGMALIPATTAGAFTPVEFGAVMAGLVIGSLLPDIDHPQSLISQMIPFVGGLISRIVGHRNVLHSLLAVQILLMISHWIMLTLQPSPAIALLSVAIIIGYVLHIIADSFTKGGVKLLYPIKWNIGLKLIHTNGIVETVFRWLLIVYCGVQIVIITGVFRF